MAEDEETLTLRTVQDYIVQRTEDGTQLGLVLKVASDLEGFGFSNDEFARFAATVLKTTSTDPQLSNPAVADNVCTVDLPVQGISFQPDSAESATVTVTYQLGSI